MPKEGVDLENLSDVDKTPQKWRTLDEPSTKRGKRPKKNIPDQYSYTFEDDKEEKPSVSTYPSISPKVKREYAKVKAEHEQNKKRAKKTENQIAVEGLKHIMRKMKTAQEKAFQKEDYKKFITHARRIIMEDGLDRIVIHGNPLTDNRKDIWEGSHKNAEGKDLLPEKFKQRHAPPVEIKPDLDVRGALDILDKVHKVHPNIYNEEGMFFESIPKGHTRVYEPREGKKEVILMLDVGNTYPRIEEIGNKIIIYADHHGIGKSYPTSSTKIVLDIFHTEIDGSEELKTQAEAIKKQATFINKFDNIQFVNEINPRTKEKYFNEDYFLNHYPRSLYNLAKVLPFEKLQDILENPAKYKMGDKKNLNWITAFSKDEIENGEIGKIVIKEQNSKDRTKFQEFTIKDYVEQTKKENWHALTGVINAEKYMEEHGITSESEFIGKTIWHNFPEIEVTSKKTGKSRKTKNTIPQSIAYLAAKARGYDAIVFYNPEKQTMFMNADGNHDLNPIWRKIIKRAPGYPEPIRNIFMFPPKDPLTLEESKKISEQEWLGIVGLRVKSEEEIEEDKVKNKAEENEKKEKYTGDTAEIKRTKLELLEEQLAVQEKQRDELAKMLEELIIEIKALPDDDEDAAHEDTTQPVAEAKNGVVAEATKPQEVVPHKIGQQEDKEEIKPLNIEELKTELLKIIPEKLNLEKKGAKIGNLVITPQNNSFLIQLDIVVVGEKVKFEGKMTNQENLIGISEKNLEIDVPWTLKLFVSKKEIIKNLPKLPEGMRSYFENKLGKKITSMYIEDNKLKFK